jgi:hypothetical protein
VTISETKTPSATAPTLTDGPHLPFNGRTARAANRSTLESNGDFVLLELTDNLPLVIDRRERTPTRR